MKFFEIVRAVFDFSFFIFISVCFFCFFFFTQLKQWYSPDSLLKLFQISKSVKNCKGWLYLTLLSHVTTTCVSKQAVETNSRVPKLTKTVWRYSSDLYHLILETIRSYWTLQGLLGHAKREVNQEMDVARNLFWAVEWDNMWNDKTYYHLKQFAWTSRSQFLGDI